MSGFSPFRLNHLSPQTFKFCEHRSVADIRACTRHVLVAPPEDENELSESDYPSSDDEQPEEPAVNMPNSTEPQKSGPRVNNYFEDHARWVAHQYAAQYDGNAIAGTKLMNQGHNFVHGWGIEKFAAEEERCHRCQIGAFPSFNEAPVNFVNKVDKEYQGLPANFKFVDRVISSAKVRMTDEAFYTGCNCATAAECTVEQCSCQEDVNRMELVGQKVNAYHGPGEKLGRLRTQYLEERYPIYECGPSCKCPKDCPNRVVQQGRKLPLLIFKTDDGRGWGVRCTYAIWKGQFVDCYFGELLTAKEAQARRDQAASPQQKDVYMFALDKFIDPDSADERLRGDPYEIDGEFFSGPTRFINHSCSPNLRIFAVVKNVADRPFHGLAFFALMDIMPHTELTFDYLDGIPANSSKNDEHKKKKCLCKAKNCRGYLF